MSYCSLIVNDSICKSFTQVYGMIILQVFLYKKNNLIQNDNFASIKLALQLPRRLVMNPLQ